MTTRGALSSRSCARVCWVGVTVEHAATERRLLHLSLVPDCRRFVSIEPMVGPVTLGAYAACLDHVIVGGESGPLARPLNLDWVRAVRDECLRAGVPFMFKQDSGRKPEHLPLLDGVVHNALPVVAR